MGVQVEDLLPKVFFSSAFFGNGDLRVRFFQDAMFPKTMEESHDDCQDC
jgi:hypothetical protein